MDGFDLVILGISSVSIHDESNVLWHGALLQGPYEKVMDSCDYPFRRW